MKYAITFRKHSGPIQNSLMMCAKNRGLDLLITDPKNMNVAPKGYRWDDYDALLWFNNHPPTVQTSAKVVWWMCDLRDPKTLGGTTTATHIGLCNRLFLKEYENFYGASTVYAPQCGNDTPIVPGRDIQCDVLFLGRTGRPSYGTLIPIEDVTRKQVLDKQFHWNRAPVIDAMEQAGLAVHSISREGATADSKWLYQNAPISLAVSLPAAGYTSNRLYNILASGGFCLTLWFPGIEDIFENHKHLVWFRSYEEAVGLAKHYLARPEKRSKIRQAGAQEYLANHTAAHRVDTMLEAMS